MTDPDRVKAIIELQLGSDVTYKRNADRLIKLKDEMSKLPAGSKEAAALDKTVKTLEQQQTGTRKGLEENVVQACYGDILWGLFNSTEFTFNH